MTDVEGTWHDGRTSTSRTVRVRVQHGLVHIEGGDMATAYPLAAVRLESRLGDLPRRLDLPGGASCQVPASFELTAAPPSPSLERWVNEAEVRWLPAIAAALVVVGGVWLGIALGVPAAAKVVAARMSPDVERVMGENALSTLERVALQPTTLPEERRAALARRFEDLTRQVAPDTGCRLVFRSGPKMGPNALALPGGTIVLLDELVTLAANDDEIVAVLAHEVGHVVERHTMRQVLQTSAAGVLLAALVGDVVSVTSYAAALPAFLLNASYSRAFEREADQFAVRALDRVGIDRRRFAEALQRLDAEGGGGSIPGWLSTHPGAAERARLIAP
ncbi:MAG: M48 family metallopeptidase [Vicinamibacterales bacterium]